MNQLLTILKKYAVSICNGDLPESFAQDKTTYYKKEPISDFIEVDEGIKRRIRSLTVAPKHYAKIDIDGKIVIGEGEMDEAPMLFIGEKVGTKKGQKLDIAIKSYLPLEHKGTLDEVVRQYRQWYVEKDLVIGWKMILS